MKLTLKLFTSLRLAPLAYSIAEYDTTDAE
jgi:hypothetical protein